MSDGMFDDVPLMNKARDKAWEAFIKRKNAATLFTDDKDFKFPLNGGFYAMWCVCWAKAWDAGFHKGVESKPEAWVGLTESEKSAALYDKEGMTLDYDDYAEAIEAKLKEKNT
jgi:hypothetical protein